MAKTNSIPLPDAVRRLGISYQRAYKAIRGGFPAERDPSTGGRGWMVKESDLPTLGKACADPEEPPQNIPLQRKKIERVTAGSVPHPGSVLMDKFIVPNGLTAHALSKAICVTHYTMHSIVRGKRGISPKIAIRLSRYFGNDPRYWMSLQTEFDLAMEEAAFGDSLDFQIAPRDAASVR